MKEFISFDSHKRYTLAERENRKTGKTTQLRIEHRPGAIRRYLAVCEKKTPVALEATGHWYWIVQEIEDAGLTPLLVHPRKAKLMMGMINKTDKLDVHGLNRLQRNETLPTVWIPPAELRDLRELTRGRMVISQHRTRLKNRITSTLAKYGLMVEGVSDSYGVEGRRQMDALFQKLPLQTRWINDRFLEQLSLVERQLKEAEKSLKRLIKITPEIRLLKTLPGFGLILSSVAALEIGDVGRFFDAEKLASYSGTTPRVHSSGGKTRYGKLRPDVNRYLKWAFIEAANVLTIQAHSSSPCHALDLYHRLKNRRGHAVAVGAMARHLAEAAYHVLSRREPYRDPAIRSQGSPKEDASANAACAKVLKKSLRRGD